MLLLSLFSLCCMVPLQLALLCLLLLLFLLTPLLPVLPSLLPVLLPLVPSLLVPPLPSLLLLLLPLMSCLLHLLFPALLSLTAASSFSCLSSSLFISLPHSSPSSPLFPFSLPLPPLSYCSFSSTCRLFTRNKRSRKATWTTPNRHSSLPVLLLLSCTHLHRLPPSDQV